MQDRMAARIERRHALFGRPVFRFFIAEPAVRSLVADPRVMRAQLLHVIDISQRSNCTIRLVPAGALLVEPFRLMEYRNYDPVVFVKTLTTSMFMEQPQDIAAYRTVLAQLDHIALDPQQSRDVLSDLASEPDLLDMAEPITVNGHRKADDGLLRPAGPAEDL
jgi:hypothetical protein